MTEPFRKGSRWITELKDREGGGVQSEAPGSGQGKVLQAALAQDLSRGTAEDALWSGWGSADEGTRGWLAGKRYGEVGAKDGKQGFADRVSHTENPHTSGN